MENELNRGFQKVVYQTSGLPPPTDVSPLLQIILQLPFLDQGIEQGQWS